MSEEKTDLEKRVNKEKNRIKKVLTENNVPPDKIRLIEPVIINTAWMKAKLEDTTTMIKGGAVVITYDNGGGQKGLRRNPLFEGYESLFKAYMTGMNKIMDCLPTSAAGAREKEEKKANVLQLVRDKHTKKA